jgi:hypothetical protein
MNLFRPVKYDKNGPAFSQHNMTLALGIELKAGTGDNIIKRRIKDMAKANEEVIKELEVSIEQIDVLFNKLQKSSDNFVLDSKTKVSKLKDMQGQLATSVANINKTISEPQLEKLVINAERLSSALELLDKLNKHGGLEKILAALK